MWAEVYAGAHISRHALKKCKNRCLSPCDIRYIFFSLSRQFNYQMCDVVAVAVNIQVIGRIHTCTMLFLVWRWRVVIYRFTSGCVTFLWLSIKSQVTKIIERYCFTFEPIRFKAITLKKRSLSHKILITQRRQCAIKYLIDKKLSFFLIDHRWLNSFVKEEFCYHSGDRHH